jgi:GT2 family glycosyltransferase
MEKLSCIILNYNTAEMTHKVVASFMVAAKKIDFEVIVIDNASNEILPDFTDERVSLIRNQNNLGFATGVNQGIQVSTGDRILLLNSDVFIDETTLTTLINYIDINPTTGIIGPMMKFPSGDFQASAGFIPTIWREFLRFSTVGKYISGGTLLYKNSQTETQFLKPIPVDWVSGGCMLINKKVIDTVGLLDEQYFFGIEDFDFCLRAKQHNFKTVYLPTVSVIHHHGYSSGGHASVYSLQREKKGMGYFLSKHFKNNTFLHFVVMSLYSLKIFFLGTILGRK